MQLPDSQKPYDIIEVRFKNSRKGFYRNSEGLELHRGEVIVVDASPGYDVGVVSLTGELVRIQMRKKGAKDNHEIRKVLRKTQEEDIERWQEARNQEKDTMNQARKLAAECNLAMKISDVEFQGDLGKATFYYTAENRVDFRELIRKMADTFKVRIEMRQIGMRQEAGRLGGIGSCGRELCCSTWLTDFRSVSTSAARYQQLSLNPQKLAGQCGKLKCCLNYELDQYKEAVKEFPPAKTRLETESGRATHFKTDIFRRIMYFLQEGERGATPVALQLDSVLEILEMNERGEKPSSLLDFTIPEVVEEEIFANVVGQDSLTRFDRKTGKSRNKRRKGGSGNKHQGGKRTPQSKGPGKPEGGGRSRGKKRPPRRKDDSRGDSKAGPGNQNKDKE